MLIWKSKHKEIVDELNRHITLKTKESLCYLLDLKNLEKENKALREVIIELQRDLEQAKKNDYRAKNGRFMKGK